MKQKTSLLYSLPIVAVSALLVMAGVWAWTDAPAAPPNSNVAAPINSGSIGQSKIGGVILNTGGAAVGLIVDKGNVGIGTTAPEIKLHIDNGNTGNGTLLLTKAASKPAFSVLPWDSEVYLSAGTYYKNNVWTQYSDTNDNLLFVLDPGGGAKWYASNNGVLSGNVAANLQLWNPSGSWTSLVQSAAAGNSYFTGNLGVGVTTPGTKLQVIGKSAFSRDGTGECCGNDSTISLAENTLCGAPPTGKAASISFHNGCVAEGTFELATSGTRRFYMFDNQGALMGLEATGNIVGNDVCTAAGKCLSTVGSGSGTVTSVGTGVGLTGGPITTTGTINVDFNTIQRRVGNCGAGNAIQTIDVNGNVGCIAVGSSSGDIEGVNAGTGLSGGGSSGTVTLSLNTGGISSCTNGSTQKIIWDSSNNRLTCGTDQTGGGSLTGSGTSNYISKWTGATSLGNSSIYDDGTYASVGGAGNTGWAWDVNKGGASQGLRVTSGQGNPNATLFAVDQYGGGNRFLIYGDGTVCINGSCRSDWGGGSLTMGCTKVSAQYWDWGSVDCDYNNGWKLTGGGVDCAAEGVTGSLNDSSPDPALDYRWWGNCNPGQWMTVYAICCKDY